MAVEVSEAAALTCCASRDFARRLAAGSPYHTGEAVVAEARRVWWSEVRPRRRHLARCQAPCSGTARDRGNPKIGPA